MERPNKLSAIKLSDPNYARTLENSIQVQMTIDLYICTPTHLTFIPQFGTPVLLENVGEELDPLLEPLLLKQTYRQAGVDVSPVPALVLTVLTVFPSPPFSTFDWGRT